MRINEKSGISKDSNDIYVYIVNLNNFLIKKTLFWRYLSEEEKTQANQYFTDTLKERYVISHGILREILSFYIQKSPHEIIFIKNNYGKPFLKDSYVHFNMSHSHHLMCCTIGYNCKLGIDIELHNDDFDFHEISTHIFTSSEKEYFSSLKAHKSRIQFFYKLWTKKEALSKAIGSGLAYPIDKVDTLKWKIGEKIYSNNEEWHYFSLGVECNYSATLVSEAKLQQKVYINNY